MTGAIVATGRPGARASVPTKLADGAYAQIKKDIFDFRFLPGERFSEAEVAERFGISRTPVREALFRLQREGYLEVNARSGWVVLPLDFDLFDHLYDLRLVLETTAVARLCDRAGRSIEHRSMAADALEQLRQVWLVAPEERQTDGQHVAELDEEFHLALVAAAGNPQIARVHGEVTERIRIIRRLDFTQAVRIEITYAEHDRILRAILEGSADEAARLLRAHIETSKAEVRKITLHGLQAATHAPGAFA